jgi:hydrogenase maturation protease
MKATLKNILIIGIGQSLRGDDGAGLAAVLRWQQQFPTQAANPDLQVELVELPGLALLDLIEGSARVLLVDAVRSGANPGMLTLIHDTDLVNFGSGSGSAHGWGVAETLALGRRLHPEKLPVRLDILAIEASGINLGQHLSPPVMAVLDQAAEMIFMWVEHRLLDDVKP